MDYTAYPVPPFCEIYKTQNYTGSLSKYSLWSLAWWQYIKVMIPSPIKMLVSGQLADQLVEYLPALLGPETEYRSTANPTQNDVAWANSFSGFDLPRQLGISHLQWVHCWGAGVEQWLAGRLSPQCLLTRTVGDMDYKIAEFCLAYSLSLGRGLFQARDNQARHLWKDENSGSLKNQHIAVLGAGAIGGEICRLYRSCGAIVTGYGRTGSETNRKFEELQEDAAQLDILIACLPKTPDTHHLVNSGVFDQCQLKQFINVGRGDTVNTKNLLDALACGRVEQAVLDVFETEPLPQDSPLWETQGLIISPHRSAPTATSDIVESIRQLLTDGLESRLVVDRSRSY